jgi:hypothetical protein
VFAIPLAKAHYLFMETTNTERNEMTEATQWFKDEVKAAVAYYQDLVEVDGVDYASVRLWERYEHMASVDPAIFEVSKFSNAVESEINK